MSSEIAISVERLSKAYLIYAAPVHRLWQAVMPRIRKLLRPVASLFGVTVQDKRYFSTFVALQDISFTVKRGESVAIIGRNGSGKSTLLKLICGTLAPTTGQAKIEGRVAAILELGSGFNPEFTGRENVLLNAQILGLTRQQAEDRLADILAFAEIGDFVDQPVKTYSSGMMMRLAFSVIAHVDADILIIDEALAVGDAYFTQKCMRWLRRFRETGTILFCGHDTGAVMSLCDRAVWINKGQLVLEGAAKDVCEAYSAAIMLQTEDYQLSLKVRGESLPTKADSEQMASAVDAEASSELARVAQVIGKKKITRPPPPVTERPVIFDALDESGSFGNGQAEIVETSLTDSDGNQLGFIEGGEDVLYTIHILVKGELFSPISGFHIKDRLGQALIGDNTFFRYADQPMECKAGDRLVARFRFRLPNLVTGRYSICATIASGTLDEHVQHHWVHDAIFFDVHSPSRNGVLIALPMDEISLAKVEA